MAIRKTTEDTFVVAGNREQWFDKCKEALTAGGFTKIRANDILWHITSNYKKLTVWGSIEITLFPEGENTKIVVKVMANVDNIYALFVSPGKRIIKAFKSNIS